VKEIVLRNFFEGHMSAEELATEAAGAFDRHTDGNRTVFSQLTATRMDREFEVTPAHIVQLVDSVLARRLTFEALDAIAFCLEASDAFVWDYETPEGARVGDSLFWLGTPEANYSLTEVVLQKVRHYLLTGEKTFTREDLRPPSRRPDLISVRKWVRPDDV
jgi:hypothetical protein